MQPAAQKWYRTRARMRGKAGIGCVIALVVVLLLIVAGVLTAVIMFRSFAAWGAGELIDQALNQVPLDEAERAEVDLVVADVVEDVKRGRLSVEDVGAVARALVEGPTGVLIAAEILKQQYLYPSQLTDPEKVTGGRTIERLMIGLDRDMISDEQMEAILAPITADPGNRSAVSLSSRGMRSRLKAPADVTPEEMRAMLSLARTAVDEAEVPDEPLEIDLAEELRSAVASAKDARKQADAHDAPPHSGSTDPGAEESPPGGVSPGGESPSGP